MIWYKYFGKEELPRNSYGENEKISQYSKFGRNINVADIVEAVKNKKQNG